MNPSCRCGGYVGAKSLHSSQSPIATLPSVNNRVLLSATGAQASAMTFTLKELVRWLGVTVFEIWMNLVAVFVFSIVAILKYESILNTSWWNIFIPLFISDGLNAYFCIIVFIRMHKEQDYRVAGLRLLSSVICLVCISIFKKLLCQKLNAEKPYSYSEVFAPVFIVLQVLMVRACQTH